MLAGDHLVRAVEVDCLDRIDRSDGSSPSFCPAAVMVSSRVGADRDRVGHRPVQRRPDLAGEVLVGVVAHGDDQVPVVYDVGDVGGAGRIQP
jgi:hypothetical protein